MTASNPVPEDSIGAHQHGIVFDEGDMRRLTNTFTRNIYRGDCQFIGGLSPKRENNVFKDHYSDTC